MLSDIGFTFARHTITTFQLLGMGALLLGIAAFLLTFSRERRTALKRSAVTDDLTLALGRIAQALERIADDSSYRIMRRAAQEAAKASAAETNNAEVAREGQPKSKRVAYSMFGR